MENKEKNINEVLRNKFLDYQVTPPPAVWENIEKELNTSTIFNTRNIIFAAIALLLIALPITYFSLDNSTNDKQKKLQTVQNSDTNKTSDYNKKSVEKATNTDSTTNNISDYEQELESDQNNNESAETETELIVSTSEVKSTNSSTNNEIVEVRNIKEIKQNTAVEKEDTNLNIITLEEGFVVEKENPGLINALASIALQTEDVDISDLPLENNDEIVNKLTDIQKKTTFWEYSILASPEFSLNSMDSVSIMSSYSLGIEPMKYLNNHWFIRSGVNISYNGDKGFAKIDYMSNDMMGTYDDVVNVTFDSLGGKLITIYHTKTVEVWDSIRHLVVSEITNKYLYANIPALIGYKNKIGKLNWYVYAGPVVGLQIAKWIDKPMSNTENISIIELDNKLPLRSTINYQLWIGGGLEYNLGKRYSLVLEPTYKQYFKSLYDNADYKINTSGFALRFGVNIKFTR
ncbi:MAG: hypothetical protein C0595_01210 [Marinilabiliales bacterium]|nr:MAG: hypothetical protein C0595_01210 [Marinilabiliales bacterium]